MVSVPERAAPVLAATVKPTVPLPAPDAPLVTVSHPAFALAVHVQVPAEAVTATDAAPPASPTFWLAGAIVIVHGGGGGAACETVNVCPPIVSVPVRAAPEFAATVNVTVPLPVQYRSGSLCVSTNLYNMLLSASVSCGRARIQCHNYVRGTGCNVSLR